MERRGRARWLTILTAALVCALVVATAPPLSQDTTAAPTGAWTETGPEGAEVTALALDPANPNVVYAAVLPYTDGMTAPNVYRSADGGQTWTMAGPRVPPPERITQLTASPVASGTLFAIVNASKLYRSTDGGGSWTQINTGPIAGGVSDIAPDPSNANVLYVTHAGRVFKSVDGGSTWSLSDTGLPLDASVKLIEVAPSATNIVYAFNYSRVYRSVDGGASWQAAAATLGFNNSSGFAVDAAAPGTLYAAAYSGGAFRSPDGGDTWTPIHTGLGTQNVDRLGVDQTQTGVLYAATTETTQVAAPFFTYTYPLFHLHRSTDGGASWTPVLDSLTRAAVIVGRGGTSYVGSGHGVYHSLNGTSWTLGNRGLPRLPVLSLLVGQTSGTLYAGVRGSGVWRSQNQGETWLPPNVTLRAVNPTALEQDPTNPNILYAATFDSQYRSGVSKSTDGGVTWTQTSLETIRSSPSGDSAPWYHDLAVQPATPSRVYVGGYFDREFYPGLGVAMPPAVLHVSDDSGATWSANLGSALPIGPVTSFAVAPAPATTAYLGAKRAGYGVNQPPTSGTVSKSPNGASWPSTAALPANHGVQALALDPSSPTTVYAGTNGARVVKTMDGGQSWASASTGLPDTAITVLTLDQTAAQTLYAGTVDQGVYKSTNGGAGWSPISASGSPTYMVALKVDPTAPSILYAIDGNRLVTINQAQIPPTSTPTPTPVSALCSPRPPVQVQTAPSGPGSLAATITLGTTSGTPTNAFQKIAFTGGQNVTVETPGSPPRPPGFEYTPGSGTTATFIVRRVNPGPFTAQLTVTDACGPWQTFVGGGANVP